MINNVLSINNLTNIFNKITGKRYILLIVIFIAALVTIKDAEKPLVIKVEDSEKTNKVIRPALLASLDIVLDVENYILIRGPINSVSADKIIESLLESDSLSLFIYIDSPGGDVDETSRIIQVIKDKQHQGVVYSCIAEYAASAAFIIYQHCDKRIVKDSSVLMQHPAVSNGEFSGVRPEQMKRRFEFILERLLILDTHQATRLQMSLEDFREKVRGDWWISGSSAVELKVADVSARISCSKKLLELKYNHKEKNVLSILGLIELDFVVEHSRCPLISGSS